MAATNPSAIIDAIRNDILANTSLNPKKTWSYVEPVITVPTTCPLLAIWSSDSDYELLTGALNLQAYERRHIIDIAWYVFSETMADTGGTGDPATIAALDATVEALIARVSLYASGIPTLAPQVVGTLHTRRLRPHQGNIWEAAIQIVAEEAT
jgi:hypothetical protein